MNKAPSFTQSRGLPLWLLIATMSLFTTGCGALSGDANGAEEDDDAEEDQPVPVEVAMVGRGDIVAVYSGTVTLEAENEAGVVAKAGGEVTALLVEEGDIVEAGQVLARIDARQLRLELSQTRANLQKLQTDYQRNIELHDKGLLSAGAFQGMQFDLDALEASHDLAKLQLSYTNITAPFAGVVTTRFVKVGNTISTNEQVFHIADLDPLQADLFVPEKEFSKLAPEQQVDIKVDALPGESFAGKVARISPVVDPQTGTFKVTVEVAAGKDRLKPGMFGRISVVYDIHRAALLVPRSALVDEQSDPAVFVVEDSVAKRRSLTLGYNQGGDIEVLAGLDEGERVIVIGQGGLKNGGKVAVVGDDSDTPEPDAMAADASATLVAEDTN